MSIFYIIIVIHSSWLLSESPNACDINVLILLNLLLANISKWSCFFFLLLVILNNFLTIPVVKEKIKVKLALTIPTDLSIVLVNEIIDTPLVVALKTIKILSI